MCFSNTIAVVVCISEPLPEPTVLVECIEKGVNLTCAVNNSEVVVSWMKNGMKANVTHAVLHISSSELESGNNFSCTVSHMGRHKSAKEVKPVCPDTGPVYQNHLTYEFSCMTTLVSMKNLTRKYSL